MVVLKYLVKMRHADNTEITIRRASGLLCGYGVMRLSYYAAHVRTDQFKSEQVCCCIRATRNQQPTLTRIDSEFKPDVG